MAFFDAFGVDVFKLAFQIINFLLILYLLNRFLFKRVLTLLDERQEKIGYKIRDAQLQKIPYMLVIGDRETAEGTVAVRTRAGGDQGARAVADFIGAAREEVRTRAR